MSLTHDRHQDEQRLEDLDFLGKEVETEIDKDKVFGQLRKHRKHVLCRPLRALGHGVVRIMLERDSAEEQGYDAAHAKTVGEKVRGVGDERDDAGLDLGVSRKVRVLETQRADEAERNAEEHRHHKREQEDASAVEQTRQVNVLAVELRQRLVHDDRDRIVEDALAKDDRVELGVDLGRVEDGQDGDGVGGRQRRAKDEALEEGKLEAFEAEERPDVREDAGVSSIVLCTHPMPTAEMNVPKNANVKMTPKLRKKFSCGQRCRLLYPLASTRSPS